MKQMLLSCLLGVLTGVSLVAQIVISDVEITQVEGNVLRYWVSFKTDQVSNSFIEYGPGQYTAVHNDQVEHRILVIGLKSEMDYELVIHAFNAIGQSTGGPFPITTGSIPPDIVEQADTLFNDASATEGYILTDARGPNIASQVRLFDRDGRLVWYDYTKEVGSPCLGNNYSNRNTILEIYGDCQTVLEINFFGDTIQKVNIAGLPGNFQVHHDMYINDLGNLVLLVAEGRAVDKSSVGGRADAIVVGDGYLEISPAGELIRFWSIFDHKDPLMSRDAGAFWDQKFGEPAEDWTHANSLAQDTDGHYLMSLNALDQAIKIHRETGEILWTIGKDGDFVFDPPDAAFANQHTFWGLGENRYTVFDNQGASTFSRGMEFELDFEAGIARLVFIQDADSTLSTGIVGSTYRYPNGNMLSSFGRTGAIEEVDSTGKVIWYRNEGTILNYRSYFVPYLYAPVPDLQLFDTLFCQNERPLVPKTNLTGGFFEGPGVVNGLFDPSSLSPGAYELFYQYAWLRDTFDIRIASIPPVPIIENAISHLTTSSEGALQWFFNGAILEGATNDSLLIFDNGDYQVMVTGENGCSSISELFTIITAGLEDVWEHSLKVFPNPSTGLVWVEWENEKVRIESIEVWSAVGQLVQVKDWKGAGNRVQIEGLAPGAYWVVVKGEKGDVVRKLVVL